MTTKGIVTGIVSNLVTVQVDSPVSQNEICYILLNNTQLMSEVIKVVGKNVYVQVFESTRSLKAGDEVEFVRHLLEVTLGPGMLSHNYDGLQNDLDKMPDVFLNAENTHNLLIWKNCGSLPRWLLRIPLLLQAIGWAK